MAKTVKMSQYLVLNYKLRPMAKTFKMSQYLGLPVGYSVHGLSWDLIHVGGILFSFLCLTQWFHWVRFLDPVANLFGITHRTAVGPELQTQTHGKNSQNEPIFGPELQTQTHGKNSISKRSHQSKLILTRTMDTSPKLSEMQFVYDGRRSRSIRRFRCRRDFSRNQQPPIDIHNI
jgi:hypothetical protein